MDIPSIKRDISRKTLRAVEIAGEELKTIMYECIGVYYGEYSPRQYNRTDIFKDSPEKGAAVSIGLGASIDLSYVDRGGHYFTPTSSWNDGIVFETSLAGLHGMAKYGTDVWVLTLSRFDAQARPILIRALAAAGL